MLTDDEKREAIFAFTMELHRFLHQQNHPYRGGKVWEVDYALAEAILYQLTSCMVNNCVEMVFEGEYLMVYQDCYDCGAKNCYINMLPEVLKRFKRIWRNML